MYFNVFIAIILFTLIAFNGFVKNHQHWKFY